jgi:hypothetical protein
MPGWKQYSATLTQPFFFFLLAEIVELSGAWAELERLQADDNELILDTESADSWRNMLLPPEECNSITNTRSSGKNL